MRPHGCTPLERTHRHIGRHNFLTGFTIVEVLVVVGILVVLIGGMTLALAEAGRSVWVRTDAQLTTLADAQRALDRLSEDLSRAKQTPPISCVGGMLSFTQPDNGGDADSVDESITYQCNSCDPITPGTLTRAEDGGLPQVVASGLTAFNVPSCSGGLVRVALRTQVNTVRGPSTQTLESQVWVRNP